MGHGDAGAGEPPALFPAPNLEGLGELSLEGDPRIQSGVGEWGSPLTAVSTWGFRLTRPHGLGPRQPPVRGVCVGEIGQE